MSRILGLRLGGGKKRPAASASSKAPMPASANVREDAPDLSKLDRIQLLRLLRDAMEENDRRRARVADAARQAADATRRAEEAEKKLEDRRIQIEDSESLAEAALRLTGIFVDAQHAIDLYGYNVAMNNGGEGCSRRERSERDENGAPGADAGSSGAAMGAQDEGAVPLLGGAKRTAARRLR